MFHRHAAADIVTMQLQQKLQRSCYHKRIGYSSSIELNHKIVLCVPNLKFLALTVPEISRGSQKFKSKSRNPFATLFDLILHFFSIMTPVMNLSVKFDANIFIT